MRLPTFLKNISVYVFANGLSAFIPLAALPIFTRLLSPEDFGLFALFSVFVTFGRPLIALGAPTSIRRMFFEDKNNFGNDLATALTFPLFGGIGGAFLLSFTGPLLEQTLNLPTTWLWAALFLCIIQTFVAILTSLFLVHHQTKAYATWQVISVFLTYVFGLAFVIGFHMDWQGRALGQMVAVGLLIFPALYLLFKKFGPLGRPSFTCAKPMLCYGMPLIPAVISQHVMTNIDRIILAGMVGLSATGLYAVAFQLASAITLVHAGFMAAWEPWLFQRLKNNKKEDLIKATQAIYFYILGALFAAGGIVLILQPLLTLLVSNRFAEAAVYIPWLAIALAVKGLYGALMVFVMYHKRTIILTYATFVFALLNIMLNIWFIHLNGAVGAAQATLTVYILAVFWLLAFTQKLHPLPWGKALTTLPQSLSSFVIPAPKK